MRPLFILLLTLCFNGSLCADSLKIHVISGSKEYQSAASFKRFLPWLSEKYDVTCTASYGIDKIEALPNLEPLKDADLLIVYARRMNLGDDQMQLIRGHWEAGKPVIGLRTASHAFQQTDNDHFDRKVMGNQYDGHYKDEPVKVSAVAAYKDHPILQGVGSFTSTKLYKAGELAPNAIVLQSGDNGVGKEAVTLIHEYKGGRMFYSSLGVPQDFDDPNFKQLLVNAIAWTTHQDLKSLKK